MRNHRNVLNCQKLIYYLTSKTHLLKLLCDKVYCPDRTPSCSWCLVSHVWPFFKNISTSVDWSLSLETKSLWTIPWLLKKQIMHLIFDLVILASLGLGEVEVCHSILWCLFSGSYSNNQDSSPEMIRTFQKIGIISHRFQKI